MCMTRLEHSSTSTSRSPSSRCGRSRRSRTSSPTCRGTSASRRRIKKFKPRTPDAPDGTWRMQQARRRSRAGVPQVHRVLPVPGRLPRAARSPQARRVHRPALPRLRGGARDAPARHRGPRARARRTSTASATATSPSAARRCAPSTSTSPTTRSSRSRSASSIASTIRSRGCCGCSGDGSGSAVRRLTRLSGSRPPPTRSPLARSWSGAAPAPQNIRRQPQASGRTAAPPQAAKRRVARTSEADRSRQHPLRARRTRCCRIPRFGGHASPGPLCVARPAICRLPPTRAEAAMPTFYSRGRPSSGAKSSSPRCLARSRWAATSVLARSTSARNRGSSRTAASMGSMAAIP